jgi:amidase
MATSAGSLALAQHRAPEDAPIVARLRAAGAVLLGKTNLSEWANFRSTRSTSGWSSLGGQTRNPYVLDRSPCGSSSGSAVAVAARLAPLAVGTETDGSIVCPASANGVVGIKPTHGLVSGAGIVPIAHSQDTAGPLARSVRDAALLLDVLAGADALSTTSSDSARPASAGTDSARVQPATHDVAGASAGSSVSAPSPTAGPLRGVRLGVLRAYAGAGRDAALTTAYGDWLATLRAAGAQLVDPAGVAVGAEVEQAELVVLLHEFHAQLDEYLASVTTGPRSLAELVAFDAAHAADVMPLFGQELLIAAQQTPGLDAQRYRDALATLADFRGRLAARFEADAVDAFVAPVSSRAWRIDPAAGDRMGVASATVAAVSGYPSIAVPAQLLDELPVAIAFIGKPGDEDRLVEIGAAFEAARGPLPEPKFLPTLDD